MEIPKRRRQHRSCDQCRKGKRACDAEVWSPAHLNLDIRSQPGENQGPCSNCKRWRKECTFNWLRSKRAVVQEVPKRNDKVQQNTLYNPNSANTCRENTLNEQSISTPLLPESFTIPFQPHDRQELLACGKDGPTLDVLDGIPTVVSGSPESVPWIMNNLADNSPDPTLAYQVPDLPHNPFCVDQVSCATCPDSFEEMAPTHTDSSQWSNSFPTPASRRKHGLGNEDIFMSGLGRGSQTMQASSWAHINDDLANRYTRSTMTKSLLRIYHDSMENALSCWLTERNCPYSDAGYSRGKTFPGNLSSRSVDREWGPDWSNRICNRVYRLDIASSSAHDRPLTKTEKRRASETLHITIMAFAAQWTRDTQKRRLYFDVLSNPLGSDDEAHFSMHDIDSSSIIETERSIRENLWNQAYKSLKDSEGIFSFQVIFANILFSLTQRPLDIKEHVRRMDYRGGLDSFGLVEMTVNGDNNDSRELDELQTIFENDRSPSFLDTALRQLFAFRYKLIGSERHKHKLSKDVGCHQFAWNASMPSTQTNFSSVESVLQKGEHHDTFNLLFWLGVMFDTLTAALHQRPPVVSDEDSRVTYVKPTLPDSHLPRDESYIDLDGWGAMSETGLLEGKPDLWGELFLKRRILVGSEQSNVPRWPCPYREAAEVLSDAAPVKVLLFRRVSHLQTLIYRGTAPESIEKAVQDTLHVYNHWYRTYGQFMLDCVAHHSELPLRIRSWYVILAGHWHLAAMLFADMLESIDNACLGLDSQRESRLAVDLVAVIRRENATAVSHLARCSLHEPYRTFTEHHQFHESLNEGALLTEPWTIILVRSFTKASLILLQFTSICSTDFMEKAQFCIDALWRLGRKSDMAFLAAHSLTRTLSRRLK